MPPAVRYVCIHGHFYQPPRENPWLEEVQREPSASPAHDWNVRVNDECYRPNAFARVLDRDHRRIASIVNNYARLSFNFGPTLLSWLLQHDSTVYARIVAADVAGAARFSGHGGALAQAYNHIILPLANPRDRSTQVAWGVRDFERRFGRSPAGMWLPETAVDMASLEALAERGIAFTVLAPHQAARVRRVGEDVWREVADGAIDTTRAYHQSLPSGRSIAIFFYDGALSRAVAFDGGLRDGRDFAARLQGSFRGRGGAELVHLATDGESYGHHHRFGEMALAAALDRLDAPEAGVRLTNYAEFLSLHPPDWEVEIRENTSWSCPHGVERWRSECGCNAGRNPGWPQGWRQPLRDALDDLGSRLAAGFEREGAPFLRDPWAARDGYLDVILDRSEAALAGFLARHARRRLSRDEVVRVRTLLEMQRNALLMYTSCGWFFDDLGGLETVQILRYAARAIDLGRRGLGEDHEERFLERLARARSGDPDLGDGRRVYELEVGTASVGAHAVAAHDAVLGALFPMPPRERVYAFAAVRESDVCAEREDTTLRMGRTSLVSTLTGAQERFGHVILLRRGEAYLRGWIGVAGEAAAWSDACRAVAAAFAQGGTDAALDAAAPALGAEEIGFTSLLGDEVERVLGALAEHTLVDEEDGRIAAAARREPLRQLALSLGVTLPEGVLRADHEALAIRLRRALSAETPDVEVAWRVVAEAGGGVRVAAPAALAMGGALARLVAALRKHPGDAARLARTQAAAALLREFPGGSVDLRLAQDEYAELRREQPEWTLGELGAALGFAAVSDGASGSGEDG